MTEWIMTISRGERIISVFDSFPKIKKGDLALVTFGITKWHDKMDNPCVRLIPENSRAHPNFSSTPNKYYILPIPHKIFIKNGPPAPHPQFRTANPQAKAPNSHPKLLLHGCEVWGLQ